MNWGLPLGRLRHLLGEPAAGASRSPEYSVGEGIQQVMAQGTLRAGGSQSKMARLPLQVGHSTGVIGYTGGSIVGVEPVC